jgi:hypothetical protein
MECDDVRRSEMGQAAKEKWQGSSEQEYGFIRPSHSNDRVRYWSSTENGGLDRRPLKVGSGKEPWSVRWERTWEGTWEGSASGPGKEEREEEEEEEEGESHRDRLFDFLS